ncbi:TPA: cystatin-like fold lipoprotein [Staphylococcus aureus]|nr:cystatin-like fold lipoprotein [Staphylococcus aureus]HDP5872518.1 cystatin-like fold lipoprotein [Staphylococcus aureus]HDP5912090.1 cystatin-like fold lipoprotein [Staphylococcus aureus]HDP5938509.1 cystatin-like fold lipoprotein [Staphylococcus aureus]
MRKRFLFITFILVMSMTLVACGKKYDKEIEEVSKIEAQKIEKTKINDDRKYKRETTNIYVYEDGKVITLTYKFRKGSDTLVTRLYRRNETTGKFEQDYNANEVKYAKEHKPDYKEENLKE